MPISLAVVSIAFQALLIIHCVKTGRNQIWIWVLAMLSFAGVIAYVAAELIPDLVRSRATQKTVRGVKRALDPGANLRRLESQANLTGGVESNQRYAEELSRQGRAAEAITVYKQTLRGLYEHDPNLMLGLAKAEFSAGDIAQARQTLDELMQHNPDFRSAEGHLFYAQALQGEGQPQRALEEYKVLVGYYPGAEAAVRYAQLLLGQQQADAARQVLKALLDRAAVAPAHYRRTQEEWLKQAERELAAL
jgi:hypothetical protein